MNPELTERIELLIDRRVLTHGEYGLTTAMPLSDGLTLDFKVSSYTSGKVLNKQHRPFNLQVYSGNSISEIKGHPEISDYFAQSNNLANQLRESGISSFELTRLDANKIRIRLDFFSDKMNSWKTPEDKEDNLESLSL